MAVELEELPRLHEPDPDAAWQGFWYHQRLLARQLRPICQIGYRREAWVGLTQHGPIRLTVDRRIQTVPINLIEFRNGQDSVSLAPDQVIVEFKFRLGMPVLFKELMEEFALVPRRLSKYRLAVLALGLVEPIEPNVAEF